MSSDITGPLMPQRQEAPSGDGLFDSAQKLARLADGVTICGSLAVLVYLFPTEWRAFYGISVSAGIVAFYIAAGYVRLYASWRSESVAREMWEVCKAWAALALTVVVSSYLLRRPYPVDAEFGIGWWASGLALTFVFRVSVRGGLRFLRSDGRNRRAAVIAGAGSLGVLIASRIQGSPWMGITIVGFYDDKLPVGYRPDPRLTAAVVGSIDQISADVRSKKINQVYIALPMRAEQKTNELVSNLRDSSVEVHFVPDVFMFNLVNSRIRDVGGVPTISIYESPLGGVHNFIKRFEDIFISICVLTIVSLPMLAIGIAIKLSSPGPIIFRQRRSGLNGEEISVWKFRTMKCCEDGIDQLRQASIADDRVTRVGKFLRRTSLDELPQFFNVLQGSMAVVGPRPHPLKLNEQFRPLIQGYMLRHLVKPGITGLAQIMGYRGETSTLDLMQRRVDYDMQYIQNWSLWLDLKIVVLTVFKGFVHKNAY